MGRGERADVSRGRYSVTDFASVSKTARGGESSGGPDAVVGEAKGAGAPDRYIKGKLLGIVIGTLDGRPLEKAFETQSRRSKPVTTAGKPHPE
jgi:hypothetical protein